MKDLESLKELNEKFRTFLRNDIQLYRDGNKVFVCQVTFFVNMATEKAECVRNLKTYGILITVNKIRADYQGSLLKLERGNFFEEIQFTVSQMWAIALPPTLSEWPWMC